MRKIRNIYRTYETDGCSDDGKCSAKLPESFFSLCGEELRDEMMSSSSGKQRKMCDCIILDPTESRVTLAELKSGKPNAGMVKHAKSQLKVGMVVLAEVLSQTGKSEIYLQLVLFSKKFRDSSALVELHKPIEHTRQMRVTRADCFSNLPDSYVNVRQSDLPGI